MPETLLSLQTDGALKLQIRRPNDLIKMVISLVLSCAPASALAEECQHVGLIDLKGQVIVPFDYDCINILPDGNFELLRYGKPTRRTVVDRDGKPIREGYEKAEAEPAFPPGISILDRSPAGYSVRNENGAGFADKKGNIIVPFDYMTVASVGDGFLAATKVDHGPRVIKYRVIKEGVSTEVAEVARGTYYVLFDPSGKKLAEFPDWARLFASQFSEGLLRFGHQFEDPTGFIDHSGAIVLMDPNIQYRENFHDGLAVVYDKSKKSAGWIDHNGKVIAQTAPDTYAGSFAQKRAIVSVRQSNDSMKFGLADTTGKFVLPAEYQDLYLYAPNVYLALKDERISFLDNNGKVICLFPPECTAVGRQAVITNNALIPCAFYGDHQPDAKAYLAPPGARWGYCDMKGRIVIKPEYGASEPQYGAAEPFQGDLAVVHLNTITPEGRVGVIDRSGKSVLPMKYRYLAIQSPDRISAVLATSKSNSTTSEKSVATRAELMKALLTDQPVIGMRRSELVQLLGEGNLSPIHAELLPAGISTVIFYEDGNEKTAKDAAKDKKAKPRNRGFEFGLNSDNKVFGWRTISAEKRGAWICGNVDLYDSKFGTAIGNVLPR